MSITIRPLTERDFFAWLGVYEGYAEFHQTTLSDQKALLVWSWLTDAQHEENALVAVDDGGDLVGLAHFREFPRLLEGGRGLFIDDLYVAENARGHGVAKALLSAVRDQAHHAGLGVVRWSSPGNDDDDARKLYDQLGTRTDLVTYELDL